ncbi:MAG TPA: segregation/condensation protein A [bacterium]|nr:segregation/condensation protein A [bacterium]HPR87266.1 segregation/condensation protein A [bacterium]
MSYKVKLESFEGPLDLLLFLIKKEEVDIYDIPIAKITQQYLQYIEIIQLLDLEAASDFILMAATLMRIKAQMLLPKPDLGEEQAEITDPRQELVQRLLEYKRFKDVAEDLGDKETRALKLYGRGSFKVEEEGLGEEFLAGAEVGLFDLVAAFKQIVDQSQKKITVHRVVEINITLEECMANVLDALDRKAEMAFRELFAGGTEKIVLVVTFIAILELIKRNEIRAVQDEPFAEIMIRRIHGTGETQIDS